MKIQIILSAMIYVSLETFAAASGVVSEVSGGEVVTVNHQGGPKAMAAAPAVAAVEQTLQTCSGGESFTLLGFDHSYDGCYSAITVNGDETWYSLGGKLEDGLFFYPVQTANGVSIWYRGAATVTADGSQISVDPAACYDSSLISASVQHPADVSLWICRASTSDAVADTDGFSVMCGCSGNENGTSGSSALGVGPLTTGGAAFLALLGAKLL